MGAHVHKTIYGPMIDMALYVMLLMHANPLLGQVEGGYALENSIFWGPKLHSPDGLMHFTRPKKVIITRAQPPPTCPGNGFARIKSITYRAMHIHVQ